MAANGRDSNRTYQKEMAVIFRKTKEAFGGLSNMAPGFPVIVNGINFRTSEALYQACRFPHRPNLQKLLIDQNSPMTAKMLIRNERPNSRSDWDSVRVKIMRWCIRVKLACNWQSFGNLLEKTRDMPIVEESSKDSFWGAHPFPDGTLRGQNMLGRLLMEIRILLRNVNPEQLAGVPPINIPDFLLLSTPIDSVGNCSNAIAIEDQLSLAQGLMPSSERTAKSINEIDVNLMPKETNALIQQDESISASIPSNLIPEEIVNLIDRFGGEWTREKLDALEHYLSGYIKAMHKNRHFNLFFIDAFAGTGICRLKERKKNNDQTTLTFFDLPSSDQDPSDLIAGSALRAMRLNPRFSHYIFIEQDSSRAEILRGIGQKIFGDSNQYEMIIGDANEELLRLANVIHWHKHPYSKAVIFLDPYAVNVEWSTLRALIETRSVDIWYLVNTATIQRLLRRNKQDLPQASKLTLDRLFGGRSWEDVVYQDVEDDGFGQQQTIFETQPQTETVCEKSFSMPALVRFIARQARNELGAWVYPKALPLRNSKKAIAFCLLFFMANKDDKPTRLASKLVSGIFKKNKQESIDLDS